MKIAFQKDLTKVLILFFINSPLILELKSMTSKSSRGGILYLSKLNCQPFQGFNVQSNQAVNAMPSVAGSAPPMSISSLIRIP